jgi:hypothetical protein
LEALRDLLVEYAQKARSSGIVSLRGLPNQPEVFKRLLDIVCDESKADETGYYGEVYHCVKAMLLIIEGTAPDIVEKGLRGGYVRDLLS